jgi:hypothetical protein
MTDYVNFQPNDVSAFQFQAVLDGTQYNCVITYNLFGERYYINIYTTEGALIVARPVVGSPNEYDISLTGGYFTTTIIYRAANKQFEISPTPRIGNGLQLIPTIDTTGDLIISRSFDFIESKLLVDTDTFLRIH